MKNLLVIATFSAICTVGIACGNEPAPATPEATETAQHPEFEDIHWRLVELQSESGEMTPLLDQTVVEVKFSGGEIGGTAGCNRYFGSYKLGEGNHLSLGSEMGSTQMACVPEVMDQEQRYLSLLGQVVAVDRAEDHLLLQDSDSTVLLKFVATELATLENTEWQAVGINNGKGGVVSTATTSRSTAVFAGGQLRGMGGCNRFTATYEIEGDRITIGPAGATEKLCIEPEGLMDQEQQYFEALGRARTFSLTPEKLELRDEGGSLQVGFRAMEE